MAYAEEAVSEFKEPSGRNYVGVYVPSIVSEYKNKTTHAFFLSDYRVGSDFTYYFGGGWNKWKFPTDADWFKAVVEFTVKTKSPLKVTAK